MKVELKKLSEVAFYQEGPGVRKTQFSQEGVKLINVTNISFGNLDLSRTKTHISKEEAFGKYKHFLLEPNDIVMASSGATWGKTTIVQKNDLPLCMNTSVIRFRPNDESILSRKYLKIVLDSIDFKNQIKKLITGSAQPNFGPTHLDKIIVSLPPLSDQIQVTEILSQAETLIKQRKKSIMLLDELLKSTFWEMFGDPVKNEKDWIQDFLENYSMKISSGSTPLGGKEVYQREGKHFIRSQNVRMNFLDYSDMYCISDEIHNRMKRTWIKNKDVLLNITGASIGRIATYYGKDDDANVNQHVCIIRTIKEKLNPRFLEYQIAEDHFQNVSIAASTGGTRESFTFEMIKKFKIILPPMELQTKFATIVEKVEALKCQYQLSLTELQNMYGVLSQKAFKGELNLDKIQLENNIHIKTETKQTEVNQLSEVEISITTEPKHSKRSDKSDAYIRKMVLAAEITNQLYKEPTFGHVKFMKLLYLCEEAGNMQLMTNYKKFAAGPFDSKLIRSIDSHFKENKWFKVDEIKIGQGKRYVYSPDVNVEKYKHLYNGYFSEYEPTISQLINLLRKKDTKHCEIVATLYYVWKEMQEKKSLMNSQELLNSFYKFHPEKEKFPPALVLEKKTWMEQENIIP